MRTETVTALLGFACVAAGCGGGGLSRDKLAKEANAICGEYSEEGARLGSPDLGDATKAKAYFTKATALARRQQDELKALEPDDDARADYERLTGATGRATTLLSDLADASTQAGSPRFAGLVRDLGTTSDAVDSSASKVGAKTCAG